MSPYQEMIRDRSASKHTALITGATQGLGRSLAFAFIRNGYNVIVHGRDESAANEVASEVAMLGAGSVLRVAAVGVGGDLRNANTIDRIENICSQWPLTVLVNNAGIYRNAALGQTTADDLRALIEVNLLAPMLLTQRLVPLLTKQPQAAIVNINSLAGRNVAPNESGYAASKAGLHGFSRAFRLEANRMGVRVLDVFLGAINTDMIAGRKARIDCIQPAEAAATIVELLRTNTSLRIDEAEINRQYSGVPMLEGRLPAYGRR